jgi:YbgC/YbaW family acyl-CoA thioester hydrolase
MQPDVSSIIEILGKFKHRFSDFVRFHQVDSFGIVHNVQYFYFIEVAHTEYLANLGIEIGPETFQRFLPLMTVHNQIDYFNPLRLGDSFEVLTRVSWYRNSSFEFQSIVRKKNKEISAFARTVLVYLNNRTLEPESLPKRILELVRNFEGDDVEHLKEFNGP